MEALTHHVNCNLFLSRAHHFVFLSSFVGKCSSQTLTFLALAFLFGFDFFLEGFSVSASDSGASSLTDGAPHFPEGAADVLGQSANS